MIISKIELYELAIPPIPAVARYRPLYNNLVCRIETDEGLVGIGEKQGRPDSYDSEVDDLTGKDPLSVDPFTLPVIFACALLDIVGQAKGIPIHRFFGEKVRNRVPVSYWSCPMEPHETAAEAASGARLGFTNHKLKARPWNIVDTVRQMKDAAGSEYTVGVDPNMKFKYLHVATRLAEELEPFGTVENFENPILKHHLDWFRLLREKTSIPIAMHFHDTQDVFAAVKVECCDQFNLSGAPQLVKKTAAIAEAADIPIWTQMGGLCLGVLAAYSVHVQATIPNAILPCDELPFIREADILSGALVVDNGHFIVPEGPGLGVELDMRVMEKYRIA